MTTLLHIDSSSSFLPSRSRHLASQFREVWEAQNPAGEIIYHDLVAEPIPHLTVPDTKVLAFPPETEEEEASLKEQERLVAEVLAADELLISSPMYNWSIPSCLKAWFDHILVVGKTLQYDTVDAPLLGRPATVFLAYGGDYTSNSPSSAMDLCGPYLNLVLNKVLGYDLKIITIHQTLTLFSDDPHERVERMFAEAIERARKRAIETSLMHIRSRHDYDK